jgi:hypothetical protein
VAISGEQPHPFGLTLDDHPVAVVFDLVDPVRTRWDLGSTGRNAGIEEAAWHGDLKGAPGEFWSPSMAPAVDIELNPEGAGQGRHPSIFRLGA